MRKAPSCSRSCAYRLSDSSFLSRVRSFVSLHPSSRRHSHVVRCEVATWRAGVCGLCVRGVVHVHAVIGVFVSVRGLTSATTFDLWASEKVACPRYSKWRRRHSQARRRFERMQVRTPPRLQPSRSIVRNQVRALSAAPALSELLSSEERYVVASLRIPSAHAHPPQTFFAARTLFCRVSGAQTAHGSSPVSDVQKRID